MDLFETNAVKNEKGDYGCPKCGGTTFKNSMHLDARTYFTNQYTCATCGEFVWTKTPRSEEDLMYWGEEDY